MKDGVFARLGGIVYRWSGWGGCQLESYEWRRVPAGTERVVRAVDGAKYRVLIGEGFNQEFKTVFAGSVIEVRQADDLGLE